MTGIWSFYYIYHYILAHFGARDGCWLQEDLASGHTSKTSRAIQAQLGCQVVPWMEHSPDVKPIENARDELERHRLDRQTAQKNEVELLAALLDTWDAIPDAFFTLLVASMTLRVSAVIFAWRNGTKY